jgi:hypothetical protein
LKCPNDGARMRCTNTRGLEDGVTRYYTCPTCQGNFQTAEFIRDKQKAGVPRAEQPISGQRFQLAARVTASKAVAAELRSLLARIEAGEL